MSLFIRQYTPEMFSRLRPLIGVDHLTGLLNIRGSLEGDVYDSVNHGYDLTEAIVVEDNESGSVAGCALCSKRDYYINGKKRPVLYLHKLRIAPEYRNGRTLFMGYSRLRSIYGKYTDDPVLVQSILMENTYAKKILLSGRANLPHIVALSDYLTFSLETSTKKNGKVRYRLGREDSLEDIVSFMNSEGQKRAAYPCITSNQLHGSGLTYNDIVVLEKNGAVEGAAILWDQGKLKKMFVDGYSRRLKLAKPFYNLYCTFNHKPVLYNVPWEIRSCFAFGAVVAQSDPSLYKDLMNACLEEARGRGLRYVITGLPENDIIVKNLKSYKSQSYRSTLYCLSFDKNDKTEISNFTYDPALL